VSAVHGSVEKVCRAIPVIESKSKTQYEVKLGDKIKYYSPAVSEIKNYVYEDTFTSENIVGTFIGIPNQFGYFFTQKDVFDLSLPATEVIINGRNYMKTVYEENGNITITSRFEVQGVTYNTVSSAMLNNRMIVITHIINGREHRPMEPLIYDNYNETVHSPYNGFGKKRLLKMSLIILLFTMFLINQNNEFFLYDINFSSLFSVYKKPYSQIAKNIYRVILRNRNTPILSRLVYDYETERAKILEELERPPAAFVADALFRR
jgi:hypothetical protein